MQLAFAAAGAALAPPGAAALGWSLGSLAYQFLFPKSGPDQHIEGPRLTDLKVSTSSYGQAVPIVAGIVRQGGHLIWSTPKQDNPVTTSQEVGGKGGGGQTVSETTHHYTVSSAYLLCRGVIAGASRIWANGVVVWDVRQGGSIEAALGSASIARDVRIYTGTTTQDRDPTIAEVVGTSRTPAYRGYAYIVFEDLNLDPWQGQIPSFEFEIVKGGSISSGIVGVTAAGQFTRALGDITPDGVLVVAWDSTGGGSRNRLSLVNPGDGSVVREYTGMPAGSIAPITMDSSRRLIFGISDQLYVWQEGGTPTLVTREDSTSLACTTLSDNFVVDSDGTVWLGCLYAASKYGLGRLDYGSTAVVGVASFTNSSGNTEQVDCLCDDGQGNVYAATATQIALFSKSTGARIYHSSLSGANSIAVASDGSVWTLTGNLVLYRWSADLSSRSTILTYAVGPYNTYLKLARDWSSGGIYAPISTGLRLYNAAGSSYTDYTTSIAAYDLKTSIQYPGQLFGFDYVAAAGAQPSLGFLSKYIVSSSTQTVGGFLTELCALGGYTAGDLDVSAMTDVLDGYRINYVGTLRSMIEPLQKRFFFDIVESDYKLKFVKRGTGYLISIPEEDLSAVEWGSAFPETLELLDGQESEVPYEVGVRYLDKNFDYQINRQYDRRITRSSLHVVNEDLSIVMDAATAARVATGLLYAAWGNKVKAKFSTTFKYAKYEPTDVVRLPRNGAYYDVRITSRQDRRGVISWEGEVEESASYTQTRSGAESSGPAQTLEFHGSTQLYLLDIPLLRDQDDDFGWYAAARGYTSGWRGAELFKSIDGGLSFNPVQTSFLTPVVAGYASGALGNHLGGDVFDEKNTLDVVVPTGTQLTGTSRLAVLNGANAALVGDEVIQFRDVQDLGSNTYRISGLRRGLRGTYSKMSTHVAGDRFILLSSSALRRIASPSSELNLARVYKAPAFGQNLAQASTISFTNTGKGKKPGTPVFLAGGRDASKNLYIQWKRAARVGTEWRDFVDASLGEDTEQYKLEVWNFANTAVLFTTTVAGATSYMYPATGSNSQTTHFGAPAEPINIKVCMISSTYGDGDKVSGAL